MSCKPISAATPAIKTGKCSPFKGRHRPKDPSVYGKYEVSPGFALQTHGVPCSSMTPSPVAPLGAIGGEWIASSSDEDYLAADVDSDANTDAECSPCCETANAFVHKLLDRKEWDAEARKAIRAEADALVQEGTWLLETVTEKDELLDWAKSQPNTVHFGELMPICSIKHFESAEKRKHKGRIVFRGDCVKDQYNLAAAFQDLSASPTTIQIAGNIIAYGSIPGHKITQADAIRAYVQSKLKSLHETWVAVPKELWPDKWFQEGKRKPMCRLNKALYGHPESGAHWERHLESAITSCGGEPIEGHPSSYWFPQSKLLLTVYVDDLLLAGPTEAHDNFWKMLRYGPQPISPEDPEDLSRFLGRDHKPC